MSKKGFLFGLVLGGAAITTAVMKLDADKKAALKERAQQGVADFKDRAIDYAFYANDVAADFKDEASQQFADAKQKVADFADQYQATKGEAGESFSSSLDQATDSLRSELARVEADSTDTNDDIVIDSAAAFGDSADADLATATSEATNAMPDDAESDTTNVATDADDSSITPDTTKE
ncbi:YtxH domain-containing protein [Lactobacillus sp. CBA3605]|uniref:YtxH domain-containing protein n=1 Tax=Lactobacillus sp. CBA3605 TaxID=2099788 RepID=UPI001F169C7A|nr:YtxH domain-containing protein [Lactobacillus sp. CBA3605]